MALSKVDPVKKLSLDSGIIRFLNRVADIMAVNIAFLITSIPVFTYGPAKNALYACAMKWARKEEAGWSDFFRELKLNFRSGILPGLFMLLLTVIACADFLFAFSEYGNSFMRVVAVIVIFVLFPYEEQALLFQSCFGCTFKELLYNTLILCLSHPLRVLIGAAFMLGPIVLWMVTPIVFMSLFPLWIFVYFSLAAWVYAMLMKKPYDQIIRTFHGTEETEETAEPGESDEL